MSDTNEAPARDDMDDSARGGQTARPPMTLRGTLLDMFSVDLRSLAMGRVALATLMLVDLWGRIPDVEAFYTDFGVLPRSEYIDNFMGQWMHSFHMMGGQSGTIYFLMAVQAVFAVCFLVGYRTRLFHFLAWLFLISFQARNPYVLQAGDVVFRLLFFWTMFLPMGACWSVDRALSDAGGGPKPPRRVLSAGVFGLILQICFVYWYSVVMKTGDEWKDGSAVYYALSLDHFATPFAKFLLGYPTLMEALTSITYWTEIFGPMLAFTFVPIFPQWMRLAGVATMVGMHIGFGTGLELGLFPWISSVGWLLLLPSVFWFWGPSRLVGWREKKLGGPLTIAYDGECGFCRKGVHLLRTLFILPTAKIVVGQAHERLDTVMQKANSWVVETADGKVFTRWDAGVKLVEASPIFFWLAPVARALGGAGDSVYGMVQRNRMRLGRWTRFLWVERPIRWKASLVGQVVALVTIGYITAWNNTKIKDDTVNVLGINVPIPKLKVDKTKGIDEKKWAYMFRLDQNWNMFAPRPMKGDGWFLMMGTTANNDIVNLFGEEPQWSKPEWIKDMYPNQRWRKYLMNIWMAVFKKHRKHYGRYVCRKWDRDNEKNKMDVFHIFYMKEQTIAGGTAPIECISLWQHWCSGRGKSVTNKPYMDHCQDINVRAAAQRAARHACGCKDAKELEPCQRQARRKFREYEKKRDEFAPIEYGLEPEVQQAVTEYRTCMGPAAEL